MGIGSDKGIRVQEVVSVENDSGQMFEVDLVDDSVSWRDDFEILKCLLTPFKETESLSVSVELHLLVVVESLLVSRIIDHDGVIYYQLNRT